MNKYINEMEDYLYNHNYISENNNNVKQQELSVERASCIVQKYRTLTEEKDKEIERLSKEKSILEKSLKLIWKKDIKINYEELDKANKIIEKEVGDDND